MALSQPEVSVVYQHREPFGDSDSDSTARVGRCPIAPGLGPDEGPLRSGRLASPVICRGFTLIEVLVVLAIVGVLAAVAIPGYSHHVRASVMREGALSLLGLALLQERLRLSRGHYQPASILIALKPLPRRIAAHYQLRVDLSASVTAYELILQPLLSEAGYPPLSLDSHGRRTPLHVWP